MRVWEGGEIEGGGKIGRRKREKGRGIEQRGERGVKEKKAIGKRKRVGGGERGRRENREGRKT